MLVEKLKEFRSGQITHLGALPPNILNKVVFPDPDGPIKANTSPGWQVPDMLKRICMQTGRVISETNLPNVLSASRHIDTKAHTRLQ